MCAAEPGPLQNFGAVNLNSENGVQKGSCPAAHHHTNQKDFEVFHHWANLIINRQIQRNVAFHIVSI
jgi:hypothetical protein